MSFEEKIFKSVDSLVTSILRKRVKKESCTEDSVVYLHAYRIRFSNLASILYGKRLQVTESSVLTGIADNVIFLPKLISISNNFEINVFAYIFRILYTTTQALLNFTFNDYDKKECKILATLLMVNRIHAIISKDYPKFFFLKNLLYLVILHNREHNLIKFSGSSLFFELCMRKFLLSNSFSIEKYQLENVISRLVSDVCSTIVKNSVDLHEKVCFFSNKINYIFKDDLDVSVECNILWGTFSYFKKEPNLITFTNVQNNLQSKVETVKKRSKTSIVVVKQIKYKKNKHGDMPILAFFQNVKTVEQYNGGVRDYDTSDELDDHFDALNDIDVNQVLRDSGRAESIFYVDSILKGNLVDLVPKYETITNFLYDEWSFLNREYKKNWCRVTEHIIQKTQINKSETESIIRKNKHVIVVLQKFLKSILNNEQWKKRELDGTEVDLDSHIDNFAALYTNSFVDNRFYKRKQVQVKDLVFSILIDVSLSTDSWFCNDTILNLEKEITLILGQVLNNCNVIFSVSFFYSNTHENCTVIQVKDFETSWSICKNYIPTILSQGYTRIGPALRHTLHKLKKIKAKTKTIILISDSKPTDYDFYEGSYGVEDVRQVLRESSKHKVGIKSLSLIDHPDIYLNRMYGLNNFYCISDRRELTKKLLKLVLNCCGKVKN